MTETDVIEIWCHRHGEKDGDKLTALGAQQVWALGEMLREREIYFNRVFYSEAMRTWQSALLLIAAMKLRTKNPEGRQDFHYSTGSEAFSSNEEFSEECERIKNKGNNMVIAFQESNYLRICRPIITKALLGIAKEMKSQKEARAILFGHSPMLLSAVPEPEKITFGLSECDGVIYRISGDKIVEAEKINAPIRGSSIY